jgi:hypothetical protein
MCLFVFACGVKLSEDEAKKIITEHFKPEPVFKTVLVNGNTDISRQLDKLRTDGSAVLSEKFEDILTYKATPKGEKYFSKMQFNETNKGYYGSVNIGYKVVKGIKELLTDSKNNTATVIVVFGYERLEPMYSLVSKAFPSECPNFDKTEEVKVIMKKYDQAWKIQE